MGDNFSLALVKASQFFSRRIIAASDLFLVKLVSGHSEDGDTRRTTGRSPPALRGVTTKQQPRRRPATHSQISSPDRRYVLCSGVVAAAATTDTLKLSAREKIIETRRLPPRDSHLELLVLLLIRFNCD